MNFKTEPISVDDITEYFYNNNNKRRFAKICNRDSETSKGRSRKEKNT